MLSPGDSQGVEGGADHKVLSWAGESLLSVLLGMSCTSVEATEIPARQIAGQTLVGIDYFLSLSDNLLSPLSAAAFSRFSAAS
jgi:hypothetical protein